jgi:hypothetical protein
VIFGFYGHGAGLAGDSLAAARACCRRASHCPVQTTKAAPILAATYFMLAGYGLVQAAIAWSSHAILARDEADQRAPIVMMIG